MSSLTAQQIVAKIKAQPPGPPSTRTSDGFVAGDPTLPITGIATTFTPTLEVLRRSAAAGRNLIVTRESPFWNRNPKALADDPVFQVKKEFIDAHKLVVYRFGEGWQTHGMDGQLAALAKALGWDHYHSQDIYYKLPATTLQALAREISSKLKLPAARVIGSPGTKVAKVALTHGLIRTPDLARVLQEPDVDAVVIGEPVEWEASPYFQDVIASGRKAGLIAIGHQASEEPGSGELAAWLKSFIPEIPVEWLPAGQPFAAGRWS